MSQLKDGELSFTDLVQFVMGRTGKGYAKSAEIVDKLYKPHANQLIDGILSELPKVGLTLHTKDGDFEDLVSLRQVTAILEGQSKK